MKIYKFNSTKDTTLYMLTENATGSNLPEEYGPWLKPEQIELQSFDMNPGDGMRYGGDTDEILRRICQIGYYECRVSVVLASNRKAFSGNLGQPYSA
jgi:hypothetical protein